ncbi:ATP-grasp domain-containing protein [Neobacillus sp.]|uniref:ATP-grasp domain-containing protein n=1 Tax=Neobacillus sp. TaxID=2675273 RepID=UPI00289B05DF|nr:ATP-grasp domain-containing protein [Neobacillus sp.]
MNVIIVGCHKGLTRCVIRSLLNSKIKFSFIGTKELIQSVSLSKLCKSVYEIEERDLHIDCQNINKIIKTLICENDLNYVIPTGIRSTLYISKYATDCKNYKNHYPISDYHTLSMLNNKWDFYQFLREHNIPTPKTVLLDPLDMENIKSLHFPIITKPLDSENSKNVLKSDDLNELNKVTGETSIPLVIQEYIPGYDINLGIFGLNGNIKAWIINRRTDRGLVFEHNKEVLNIGEEIVKALHFSGIIHFDLRCNELEGTIFVLECNPRVWGSMLHSTYAGVNFMELAINHQSNENDFNEIKTGMISLNKKSLIKKLLKTSLSRQDLKSIFAQAKLFVDDPIYELNFILKD